LKGLGLIAVSIILGVLGVLNGSKTLKAMGSASFALFLRKGG